MRKINIGTRGSLLALAQANIVKDQLLKYHKHYLPDDIDIQVISTSGDRIQDQSLATIGGKGLFTKEIEEALLAGTVDIAVHSMKDMPAIINNDLEVNCFLRREDPRDALISMHHKNIEELPTNSIIGTSSARRKAQLLNMRSDLQIVPFRGNVTTRIEKLANGKVDATLLAMAGLNRLSIDKHLYTPLSIELLLPAVAQGAIGIETKKDDTYMQKLIAPLNCSQTNICVKAERAYLKALNASCNTSVAALAVLQNDNILFKAQILRPDGSEEYNIKLLGSINEAEKIAERAASKLLDQACENFFTDCLISV